MKPLPLDKALELHGILSIHIPDEIGDDSLEFIGKIIKNIRESERHKDYVDAVMLMTELDFSEITQMSSEDVLELFTEGLATNKILSLNEFCKRLGINYA